MNNNLKPFENAYKHKYLVLYITEKCNLSCPKCYVENKKNVVMSKETADKIIEYVKKHDETYTNIIFIGGEPTLEPHIMKYIYDALEYNPKRKFTIMTNGTTNLENIIDIFDWSRVEYNISFDYRNDKNNWKKFETAKTVKGLGANVIALIVNTPEKMHENLYLMKHIVKYYDKYFGAIILLKQHKACDFWNKSDVVEYSKILPDLIHLSAWYHVSRNFSKTMLLPNKPTIQHECLLDSKSGGDAQMCLVCQDSHDNRCVVVGPDGMHYICDGAYGEKKYSLGYIWDETENIYKKEFGYTMEDGLYEYCFLSKNKTLLSFDRLTEQWRRRYASILNKLLLLKGNNK